MDILTMNEQLLASYLDAMPAEVYIKDLDGNYIYANRQFEITHGILRNESTRSPQTDANLYTANMAKQKAQEDQRVIDSGTSVCTHRVAADNSSSNMIETKFPLLDDEGSTVAIAGMVHSGYGIQPPSPAVVELSSYPPPDPLPESARRRLKRPKSAISNNICEEGRRKVFGFGGYSRAWTKLSTIIHQHANGGHFE